MKTFTLTDEYQARFGENPAVLVAVDGRTTPGGGSELTVCPVGTHGPLYNEAFQVYREDLVELP